MPKIKIATGFLAAVLLTTPTLSHEVWLERGQGNSVRIFLGELPEPEPNGGEIKLDDLKAAKLVGRAGPVKRRADYLESTVKGPGDVRLIAFYKPWKNETGGFDGAVFRARLGRTDIRAKLDFEIVPLTANGDRFQALYKGSPLPSAVFTLINPDYSWREITADKKGVVSTSLNTPGRYIMMVYHTVEGPYELDNQSLDRAYYVSTLSFVAP